MGSVIEYLDQRRQPGRDFPSYVYLPNRLGHLQGYDRTGQYGGWLGRAYNALATDIRKRGPKDNPFYRPCTDDELDFRIKGVDDALTLDRLDARRFIQVLPRTPPVGQIELRQIERTIAKRGGSLPPARHVPEARVPQVDTHTDQECNQALGHLCRTGMYGWPERQPCHWGAQL